jgi:hypothetical protein
MVMLPLQSAPSAVFGSIDRIDIASPAIAKLPLKQKRESVRETVRLSNLARVVRLGGVTAERNLDRTWMQA